MQLENIVRDKRPFAAAEPFPWRCHQCGKNAVEMATIDYAAEVQHDGRLHAFVIPSLRIPVCQACGARVFTQDVDQQVNDALRSHLQGACAARSSELRS
jgi:hypothetical protein